ncbi:hypothetical protein [Methylobacterium dankookense]|uniref:Uncharacterized protein n=1 Tax=Methylobacterium dankookense TaxID=560405 RepID=A0A564FZS1_9HYPH|nr:hypothetical protein [Methylobacterium dankookense]GJD57107.1 hypothetical protein IFDJLNFL_3007 [Methylobacterium dankookense]VUF13354.1 hypothetical protein MTDSW087_03056 [Methylobacterium dankookense]
MQSERRFEPPIGEGGTEGLADRRRLPLVSLTLRLAAASAAIAALSLLAHGSLRRASAPQPEPPAEVAATPFVPSTPAAPAKPALAPLPGRLALADPDGLDPVRIEPARINPATGLREEVVARGAFDAIESPALRLTLTRDAGTAAPPSLFVTLARRAADGPALAVIRTGARGRVATKFGTVETLEATLAGAARRICTGFVTLEAAPARIDGWLCAPLGQPPEPRALACALDGLTLDGAEEPAAGVFRAAEGRRDPACGNARPSAAAEAAGRTGSIRGRRQVSGSRG